MSIIKNKLRLMINEFQQKRNLELRKILEIQPYELQLKGLKIKADKDVFPPDLGLTTLYLADILPQYITNNVLNMGCGTGFLAILMQKLGCQNVVATDIHVPAVECTIQNIKLNNCEKKIDVIKSNLFSEIPLQKFNFIVFNQPYYPANGIFGLGEGGGKRIICNFFNQAKNYINKKSVILMPFSTIAGNENNPCIIAKEMGFNVDLIFEKNDLENTHSIFKIYL